MNGLAEFFKTLGPARLAAMATVAAITIGFFIFLSIRLSTPTMSLLFSGLDLSDSSKIVQTLEAQAIPYELVGDGSTILVPDDQVNRIRIAVAEQGLTSGGSVGNEIFDRGDSLGATSFVQNINRLRALEGELARTIQSIDKVTSARIHLVMPERRLFSNENREATASIFIKTSSGRLPRNQIMAIQNLVAAAVPDLQPERISIVDQKGSLLARGSSEDVTSLLALSLEEKKISMESRLRGQIETLLEKTVGLGNVRAEVSAELDLNRITSNTEEYDPDSQVARSENTSEQISTNQENAEAESVSVANNLPDQTETQQEPGVKSQTNDSTTTSTVNYEISKTIRTQIHEAGTIKKISVAVLVDGTYQDAGDGSAPAYQARSQADLDNLKQLVESTIGFDAERGDTVDIVNMQFAAVDYGEAAAEESLFDFSKADIMRFIELGGLMLIGILVIFFALRPLIKFLTAPPVTYVPNPALEGGAQGQLPPGQAQQQAALSAPANEPISLLDDDGKQLPSREVAKRAGIDSAIDVAAVEGKIQATALKKVGELVERHPEESVAVVRGWLYG
ncbi:flagellar basal-body MS-ring/collar protein FliF [Paremcibacter congregatus]|uniref:flagellar basal-body MS-ring/collar protein FliF n=1 Tax=Paremcibacter congregatus TaxID=2043170 RepID=UPI0013FE3828|nr:flagellar basal-body MS-ring/collar protein FliF [Paremcibacter congregatus]